MSHPEKNQCAASAGDFSSRYCLLEFGSLESPPSNLLKATRKPDRLVWSEIQGSGAWVHVPPEKNSSRGLDRLLLLSLPTPVGSLPSLVADPVMVGCGAVLEVGLWACRWLETADWSGGGCLRAVVLAAAIGRLQKMKSWGCLGFGEGLSRLASGSSGGEAGRLRRRGEGAQGEGEMVKIYDLGEMEWLLRLVFREKIQTGAKTITRQGGSFGGGVVVSGGSCGEKEIQAGAAVLAGRGEGLGDRFLVKNWKNALIEEPKQKQQNGIDDAKDGDVDDKLVRGTISLSDIYSRCNVVVVKTTNFEEPISSNHLDFLKRRNPGENTEKTRGRLEKQTRQKQREALASQRTSASLVSGCTTPLQQTDAKENRGVNAERT
ncbi:hypothetical protein NC653_026918 [Populus alba x Populus x berolinensis]|uniref:Uncharacterized protein n=1 Tax=Populus alba x Populus x berolinensis TaxID=444605 RepID=A0AAD6M560_9ROSI|nr:hypothetical protein NC653_026918 [Populus alba x Populus x berolinensis]